MAICTVCNGQGVKECWRCGHETVCEECDGYGEITGPHTDLQFVTVMLAIDTRNGLTITSVTNTEIANYKNGYLVKPKNIDPYRPF